MSRKREISPGDQIRMWMIAEGFRASDFARDLGISQSAVTHYLNGRLTSQRIREYFASKGCSERLLDRLGKAA